MDRTWADPGEWRGAGVKRELSRALRQQSVFAGCTLIRVLIGSFRLIRTKVDANLGRESSSATSRCSIGKLPLSGVINGPEWET